MATIKLKKLEEYLQGLDTFEKPKILLEQYETPSHIASYILYDIQTKFQDLEGKIVADLGSGCGMLTIGAFLMGAQFSIGFELDIDAAKIFKCNADEMEVPGVDCVLCDVVNDLPGSRWEKVFDTVILNPPFGTKKNAGMDVKFLETAFALSQNVVYSLHKSSTREFFKKKCSSDWNVTGEIVAELRYNLDSSYRFHKKKSVDIEVDLWRFQL